MQKHANFESLIYEIVPNMIIKFETFTDMYIKKNIIA